MILRDALESLTFRSLGFLALLTILGRTIHATGLQTEPDWVIVDRHVSQGVLDVVADILELSSTQREHLDPLWEQYDEDVTRADADGAREWEVLRHRSVTETDFAGEPYDDAVSALVRATLKKSDLLLESLLADIAAVLSESQAERLPRVRDAIDWESFFEADMGSSVVDLGGRHDVRALHRAAITQGILPSEEQVADAGASDAIRASEDAYVAGVLQQIRWARQHTRTARGDRRTKFGPPGRPRRWWQRIQSLSLAHADAIASVAENVAGNESAWRWRELFARTAAPRISRDLWLSDEGNPEAWLDDLESEEIREAVLAAARAWREDDRQRIWELVERGIRLINREGSLSGSSPARNAFLAAVLERFAAHEVVLRDIARMLESAGIPAAMVEYRKGARLRLDLVKSSVPLNMRDRIFEIEDAPRVLVELQAEFGANVRGVLMSPPRTPNES